MTDNINNTFQKKSRERETIINSHFVTRVWPLSLFVSHKWNVSHNNKLKCSRKCHKIFRLQCTHKMCWQRLKILKTHEKTIKSDGCVENYSMHGNNDRWRKRFKANRGQHCSMISSRKISQWLKTIILRWNRSVLFLRNSTTMPAFQQNSVPRYVWKYMAILVENSSFNSTLWRKKIRYAKIYQ